MNSSRHKLLNAGYFLDHTAQSFPCKYFHRRAKCSQGADCRFSHEPLDDVTSQLLDEVCNSAVNETCWWHFVCLAACRYQMFLRLPTGIKTGERAYWTFQKSRTGDFRTTSEHRWVRNDGNKYSPWYIPAASQVHTCKLQTVTVI